MNEGCINCGYTRAEFDRLVADFERPREQNITIYGSDNMFFEVDFLLTNFIGWPYHIQDEL